MSYKYTVKEIADKKTWENFVLSRNPQSFLQSWNWGETNQLAGEKIFRLAFFEEKNLAGVCLVIKQEARRGPHLIVPGGPLIDWGNKALVDCVLKALKDLARREKVWFIRVRPELLDSSENRTLFKSLGFLSAPMHLHAENTLVLDITPDEEILLKGMRKSTRYEIRKSLKLDLKFRQTTDPGAASLLKKLQDETVTRHKFVGFPEKLFRAQLETFGRDGQAALFTGELAEEILTAAIIIFYGGIAYYHHSGSSNRSRKIPASHFLQWKIIQEAKKRGCTRYNSPLYWLTYLFETLRRTTRSL